LNLLRHPLTTSFGITTIILMTFVDLTTSSLRRGLFYHWDGPVYLVIGSICLVILTVWILISLLLIAVRNHPKAQRLVWILLGIVILRELLEAAYIASSHPHATTVHLRYPSEAVNIAFWVFILLICLSLTVPSIREYPVWRQTKNLAIIVLGFVAISGCLMVVQLLEVGWTARNLNAPHVMGTSSLVSTSHHKRVLWLLLDELSYNQVYAHRFPGLQLPEFDRLAAQSTVFTNAIPAGMYTQEVLPSLIVGQQFDDVNYHTAGPLALHPVGMPGWVTFNPRDTVFQDAVDQGYRTGVVGWYNPYCRLVPDQLASCYWNNAGPLSVEGVIHDDEGLLANTRDFLLNFLELRALQLHLPITPKQGRFGSRNVRTHLDSYQILAPQADKVLLDPSLDFVFLHIPVPHPPGIYNRHTNKFSIDGTSYIDNLALTDIYLGHIRQELQANGTWDDTTIVIMGDHSWRTNIEWNMTPIWTPEDQLASDGGKFDPRPGYIVKLAGQTTPAHIDVPYQAIRTRSLLDNILQNKITTPEQLAAWVGK